MRSFLLLILLITRLPLFAQETDGNILWEMDEVKLTWPDTSKYFRSVLVDTATGTPVTGWLVRDYPRQFSVAYYENGRQHGFFATYKLVKNEFHLVLAGRYREDHPSLWITYDPKEQHVGATSYNYGLKKIEDYDPLPHNAIDGLQKRKIRLRHQKLKITDTHYDSFRSKEYKFGYSAKSFKDLIRQADLDTIDTLFPVTLNEWKHPFTHLRFDGYYSCTYSGFTQNFRFYPDTTVDYIERDTALTGPVDWNTADVKAGAFLLSNNWIEISINDKEIYSTGILYPGRVLLSSRDIRSGCTYRLLFEFVELPGTKK